MTAAPPDLSLAAALAALARTRDPRAWAVVLDQAGGAMEALARRLTGNGDLARDAVQEALLHIRDSAQRFEPPAVQADRAARSWILRITAHVALSLHRRQQRRRHHEGHAGRHTQESQPMSVEPSLAKSEEVTLVRTHLAALPEPTRAAIVLHHCEGLAFTDVAKALGVPEGTAKVRVHRGMNQLRRRLGRLGFAGSLAVLSGLLSDLPGAESGSTPYCATDSAQALLTDPVTSTVPMVGGGISMGMVAMTGAAAVVAVIGLCWGLIQPPESASDPTTFPQTSVEAPHAQQGAVRHIVPQPMASTDQEALLALDRKPEREVNFEVSPEWGPRQPVEWKDRVFTTDAFDICGDVGNVDRPYTIADEPVWRTVLDRLAAENVRQWRLRGRRVEFLSPERAAQLQAPLDGASAPDGPRGVVIAWFKAQTGLNITLHPSLGADDGTILHWKDETAAAEAWLDGLALALTATAFVNLDGTVLLHHRPEVAPLETVFETPPGALVFQEPPTARLNEEVTLDFIDIPFPDVIARMEVALHYPIEWTGTVSMEQLPPISLRVQEMKVRYTLGYVCRLAGTTYALSPSQDRIFLRAAPPADEERGESHGDDMPPLPTNNF